MKSMVGLKSVSFAALFFLSACNVFSPFNSPSDNEQILSAARAYFNQGEMEKALAEYAKLTDSYADRGTAESAFVVLAQNDAKMTDFIKAVLGDPKKGLTTMASSISTAGASQSKRKAFFDAYQSANNITEPKLRAFVRFITSFALTAELLAEEAGGDELTQADLVDDVAACTAADAAAACFEAGCTKTSAGLETGTSDFDGDGTEEGLDEEGLTVDSEKGNLNLLFGSITAIGSALTELGDAEGGLASGSADFSEAFALANTYGCAENAYRNALLSQGIGQ